MDVTNLKVGGAAELQTALITGASGLLGHAISQGLTDAGWRLALAGQNISALNDLSDSLSGESHVVAGDLAIAGEGTRIAENAAERLGSIHLFLHLASPPVLPTGLLTPPQDLEQQLAVNVRAFLEMSATLLPEMLKTQTGTIISLLSQALLPPPPHGWQSYTIAKAGLAQAAAEIAAAYGQAGIRVLGVLPGLIAAEKGRQGAAPTSNRENLGAALAANDVAERIIRAIGDENFSSGMALSITPTGISTGHLALSLKQPNDESNQGDGVTESNERDRRLSNLMQQIFNLSDDVCVEDGQLGVLPGWDSLGHIKLIMEIEAVFDVSFDAEESSEITTYNHINNALKRRGIV